MLEKWEVILLVSHTYRYSWSAPWVRKAMLEVRGHGRCPAAAKAPAQSCMLRTLEEEHREPPLLKCAMLHYWVGQGRATWVWISSLWLLKTSFIVSFPSL